MDATESKKMIHSLYTGVSQSGKTTLARMMARIAAAKKDRVIVYDPMGTPTAGGAWGEGTEVHEDLEAFLETAYHVDTINAHLFIDEAHHVFNHADKEHLWLLTQGRHYGLQLHLMTQRPTKVHPDARTNCGRCYMFRLAHDDARAIGLDYGFSEIHKISLDKGDFLVLNSGTAQFSSGNIFKILE
jgi:energy-coupling factor transporter ATP-binding protein EcfA2